MSGLPCCTVSKCDEQSYSQSVRRSVDTVLRCRPSGPVSLRILGKKTLLHLFKCAEQMRRTSSRPQRPRIRILTTTILLSCAVKLEG
ncbi:hypothetical protein BDW75DRAFT_209870 [Aspergillus navahoensis]